MALVYCSTMDQFIFIASLMLVFLAAGTVKGVVGLGLPTTSLGLMTLFVAPRTAIAIVILPLLLTNAWQVYRAGEIGASVRRYAPLIVALVIFVWVVIRLSSQMDPRILLAVMGFSILLYVVVNLTKFSPRIPQKYDTHAQLIAGVLAGILGGLTSVWAPPMAVYLTARRVTKAEFIRASGLIFFLGSVPLAAGYIYAGHLTPQLAGISALILIPTFIGFWFGEKMRAHLSETAFRNAVLVVFLIMGLNLLRRAYLG